MHDAEDQPEINAHAVGGADEPGDSAVELRRLWFLLRRMARVLDRYANARLHAAHGIGLPLFLVLATVAGRNGRFSQQNVADHLGVTKGSVSRQIAAAEEAKLLVTTVSRASRRENVVTLTARALSLVDEGKRELGDLPNVRGLDADALGDLERLLTNIELLYGRNETSTVTLGSSGLSPVAFLIRKDASLMDRGGDALYRARLGMSLARFLVLSAVEARPGIVFQQELADHLGLHATSVSRHLDGIGRDGLITVTRYRDPGGAHRMSARPTPSGSELIAQGRAILAQLQPQLVEILDERSLASAVEMLHRISRQWEPQ